LVRAGLAVLVRPPLWFTAAAQLMALAPDGWWRSWPPLPLPDPAYLRFRLVTQYGDPTRTPDVEDVLSYLRWCRNQRRAS
jgi:hypothetical protein